MIDLSKIEILAKENNISLKSLAEKAGITYQALNKLMRNNSTKVETLVSISEALGVSPSYFFGIEKPQMNISPAAAEYLREKDKRIEELVAENERLRCDLDNQKKEAARPVGGAGCADVV